MLIVRFTFWLTIILQIWKLRKHGPAHVKTLADHTNYSTKAKIKNKTAATQSLAKSVYVGFGECLGVVDVNSVSPAAVVGI